MDNIKESEEVCINLEFLRSKSLSEQAKIQEFWKYLDGQDILKPYEVSKASEEKSNDSSSKEKISITNISSSKTLSPKSPVSKQSLKKEVKEKKPDNSITKLEKYLKEDLKYADSVEMTYDEINAEIEEFQRRLLRCSCKKEKCDCKKYVSK